MKFSCPVCKKSFPKEVWHCPGCDNHNLIELAECETCSTQKPGIEETIPETELEISPPPIIAGAIPQLPLTPPEIPTDWDYNMSLNIIKPLIYHWKNITLQIATELWIAREILSTGGRPKSGTNIPLSSWAEYCEAIGLEKRTANRWLAAIFGNVRLPSPELPKLESQVIYADPPWAFNNAGFDQSAASIYPTLTIEEICNYSDGEKTVRQLSNEKESVLFLWVPESLIPEGLMVTRAWGFNYKAQLVWKKDRAPGMGWWVNSKHEILFIAARGNELQPEERFDSVFESPVTDHSKKPAIVYEMIEAMYSGPYIELFARNTREGWVSWGNQV